MTVTKAKDTMRHEMKLRDKRKLQKYRNTEMI